MKLIIIVATSLNNAIGKENKMLWHLPNDFKFFKQTTMGSTLIMGRKTFESIGKPLPGRTTIIITRSNSYSYDGCIIAHSLKEALELVKDEEKVFVVGGGEIYKEALPFADELYITKVNAQFEADTFFPAIIENQWIHTIINKQDRDEKHAYEFKIHKYEKIRTNKLNRFLAFVSYFISFAWLLMYFKYEKWNFIDLFSSITALLLFVLIILLTNNYFVRHHLRNALGIILIYISAIILMKTPLIHDWIKNGIGISVVFILLINIWGAMNALKNKIDKLPLFGNTFQKLFPFI